MTALLGCWKMSLPWRSLLGSLSVKVFAVCLLMAGASSTYNERTGADDILRRRTPMEFLRETVNFLSSEPDSQLVEKLRGFQEELTQTSYLQLLQDVFESGVLGNEGLEDRTLHYIAKNSKTVQNLPAQEMEKTVGADDGNTTTPSHNLTTPAENANTTAATLYPTTTLGNVTKTEPSTAVMENTTTAEYVSTTPSSNATTPAPNPVSAKCRNDTAQMLAGTVEGQKWALQMLDAAGKPSPNLEGYQFFWVGDDKECTKVRAVDKGSEHVLFRGRYCTAVIPFLPLDVRPLMPALPPSGIRIGLCVPDSCSGQDVTVLLNEVLSIRNKTFQVGLTTCQEETVDYDTKAIVVLFLCSLFLLLMVLGTGYDLLVVLVAQWAQARQHEEDLPAVDGAGYSMIGSAVADRPTSVNIRQNGESEPLLGKRKRTLDTEGPEISTKGKILLAFSVYTNGKKIMNASHTPGSISCIHGIRFLSMTWVILGHTFIFGLTTAENYLTYLSETKGLWSFQVILGAPAAVDTFFALSGLLVAYLILKEMEKRNGKVQWFLFYFHRFWRLTPPYACVMMMLVALFRYAGNGPNWPQDGTEVNSCQDTWWTNLLYVNNFVRVKEMCINWSWYLANDMQFYIISPLLFVPMFYWRKIGVAIGCLFLLATLLTAGIISRVNHFPPSVAIGGTTASLVSYDYFTDFYIKPYCRFGPYVIGMLTGYALFTTKCQIKMNLVTSLSGWAMAAAAGLAVVYGLYEPANGHSLTDDVSALYNSASHSVWGACVCWVIFACATGHGGPVNALLSWTAFIPLSRLTYMAYLVHPIIMNLYHLGAPSAFYMSSFHNTILFLGFTVAAFGSAFILSLAFEAPMMALEKVLLPKPQKH